MITDEERREVAKKLREQAENSYFTLMQWWDHLQLTVMGKVYLTAPEKVYLALADLIDRGVCYNVYDESECGACDNGFECSVCGCKVEDEEHYHVSGTWNFCPQCGKRVWPKK